MPKENPAKIALPQEAYEQAQDGVPEGKPEASHLKETWAGQNPILGWGGACEAEEFLALLVAAGGRIRVPLGVWLLVGCPCWEHCWT